MEGEVKFEYKGFKYAPWDDHEEDNIKRFHDVITPEGKEISLPYSPYSRPSEINFQRWVDLGCPLREKFKHNICNEDIEELWRQNSVRFINEKDPKND